MPYTMTLNILFMNILRSLLWASLLLATGITSMWGQSLPSAADLVNPLVGTLSSFEISTGNTYPVISAPWGMNSWTPQTGKMGDGWQYTYTSGQIRGFKQTHQPSPWINDYGQFAIMPMVSEQPIFDEDKRASWFSHKSEQAHPYRYQVYLADYDTRVSLSPTARAAVFEIEYGLTSTADQRWVLVDAFDRGSEIWQDGDYRLVGYSRKNSGGVPDNFKCYFVVEFEDPIAKSESLTTDAPAPGGRHAQLAVTLRSRSRSVRLRVASSFVSHEQALLNLREVQGRSLKQVASACRDEWNRLLGRIEVQDDRPERATFYSNLYRSLLFPRRFWEIDREGDTIHYSPYNGQVLPGYMYTDTGVWDTFRALFPLIHLVYPEEGARMQEGMLHAYRESGFLPEWASPGHRDCMVGNNAASVVAGAFLKGIASVDTTLMVEALLKSTRAVHPTIKSTGRYGHEYYNKLGYIPTDVGINESAARTLEYAYADWCIAEVLKRTKAPKAQIRLFEKRAQNYRHLYDQASGWMRGRQSDGAFQTPFSPYKWGDAFTEGNAIHYTWSVFHDIQGLIDLVGGDDAFVSKLDTVFTMPPIFDNSYYGFTIHEIREMQIMDMGNYAHGNQPIQHMLYLYAYAGRPDKGQKRIREVMRKLYSNMPDGYCGDEDNGQTSAWYVFSALGFYPVVPASDQYVLGIPYFDRVVLHLPEGKTIIEATNAQADYVQSLSWRGQAYERNYVRYDDLRAGGRLHFVLADEPSRWGHMGERPYSMSSPRP